MIDSHAHLYSEEFDNDRNEALARAQAAGVQYILLPNIDEDSISRLNDLATYSGICKPMMGLHPCYVQQDYKAVLARIYEQFDKNDYIAVGEIGIDLHWDKASKAIQEDAFRIQCRWALEMNLPIAIHTREATDVVIDILQESEFVGLTGVFHCFGGTKEQADIIIGMGFLLGIGGVVTFKNTKLREVLHGVSLDHIILETDAPYLAPVPYRGKRNEPAHLQHVVSTIASIYELSVAEVIARTSENTLKLFKI